MTLVMVAKDGGFFQKEGLDVELKQFTAGKFALQAFLSGAIDYAVSGEVPVALATLQGNQTRVVTQVVESTVNEVRMVARRDDNLTTPAEYFKAKRRKLATSFGGGPEFYTYSFLKHYGIPAASVEIISQKPEDMPAALATGSVDAVAIFEPFAYFAEKRTAGREIVFSDPSLYSELYVLNARPEQIAKSPNTVEAVVRALVNASAAIAKDPESAKQTMQKYTKLDREVADAIWPSFVFRPALTQKLLDDWAAEADWAKDTGKIPADAKAVDFHTILEPRFLQRVNPSMVMYQASQ
jgi:ABC-type nitrate/sulfonate/bicarbonate transport system substrate-binding protein